jgi:hypothetical protein
MWGAFEVIFVSTFIKKLFAKVLLTFVAFMLKNFNFVQKFRQKREKNSVTSK